MMEKILQRTKNYKITKMTVIKFCTLAKILRFSVVRLALVFFIEMNFSKEIPNLFFILIFFLSLYRERYVFLAGVFFGLIKDILSISKFPLNTVLFGAWSYFLPKIFKRFYKENIFFQISIFISCIWINSVIFFLYRRQFFLSTFLTLVFLESLYGAFIYLLLFRFLKRCIQN